MALSKKIQKIVLGQELIFNNAYIQIVFLSGSKNGLKISVNMYDSKNKENIIHKEDYTFIPSVSDDSKNFIKQGYEFLKTLDEYKDALDVLEDDQF